jgi:peroxiredoxin Q/BCP
MNLPNITLNDQNGNPVNLRSFEGKPLVLFFYPKAASPGCTAEACSFRDQYEAFTEIGAEVVGISRDSVEEQSGFASGSRLPFTLLSDPDGKAHKALGVTSFLGLLPRRITLVFDKSGNLADQFEFNIRFNLHSTKALERVHSLISQEA